MKKLISWLLLAVFLTGCTTATLTPQVVQETVVVKETVPAVEETVVVQAPTSAPAPAVADGPVSLEVFDPTGAIEVTQVFNARLDTLEGKTICEVTDNIWEADRSFPLIRQLLQAQFPTAKFIPYTDLPTTGDKNIGETVKAKGCQGVILGNAG